VRLAMLVSVFGKTQSKNGQYHSLTPLTETCFSCSFSLSFRLHGTLRQHRSSVRLPIDQFSSSKSRINRTTRLNVQQHSGYLASIILPTLLSLHPCRLTIKTNKIPVSVSTRSSQIRPQLPPSS
jgi:hypothetical protein